MKQKKREVEGDSSPTRITGLLKSMDWDGQGVPYLGAIIDADSIYYFVVDDRNGSQLMRLNEQMVSVLGYIHLDQLGRFRIRVLEFSNINGRTTK